MLMEVSVPCLPQLLLGVEFLGYHWNNAFLEAPTEGYGVKLLFL